MRLRFPLISAVVILAIASCGKPDPVANDLKPMNLPVAAARPAPAPAGGPPATAVQATTSASSGPEAPIPAALRGRWGLTPADCTGPLASAKGLLVIASGQLRFYESRAVPSPDVRTDAGVTSGNFHFTGEGQAWNKFEALKRTGDRVTRTETNPAASYTYVKC